MEKGRWRFWGVQNDPNKAQGEFSRVQSSFFLGNGAAGSPLHLPRLGRFYWNKEKKNQVFCLLQQKKEGGEIPSREAATDLSPQIFHGRGIPVVIRFGAHQRSHGGATGRPRVTFSTQFPIFMCSGSGFPALGSRLQPSKKIWRCLKKNQSSVKNEAVVASFGASQEGFYS